MVRITEDLLRKSSEHNEGIISTLEEVALHQRDIDKIENIGNWCRELKILDLTSNVIPKIENLHKLKKLEYLKLGLNVIERVENLEGCESLKKLDLTVNFIGELTSIESLQSLQFLEEMYLMGNPCTEFEGYREYVVATLPRLKFLDGHEITKSERIHAYQNIHENRPIIIQQQKKHLVQRQKEKDQSCLLEEVSKDSEKIEGVKTAEEEADEEKKFWDEQVPYTPETRMRVHDHIQKKKEERENANKPKANERRERKLVADDGRILNVNEAKFDFQLTEDDEQQTIVLDIAVYRYMDTSLINIDVNPTYVTGTIRGKVFQLVLPEEVQPSSSQAQRLKTNGHLVLTMPKMKQIIKPVNAAKSEPVKSPNAQEPRVETSSKKRVETLEIDPNPDGRSIDYRNIINENENIKKSMASKQPWWTKNSEEKALDEDFIDDPDVPPLVSWHPGGNLIEILCSKP